MDTSLTPPHARVRAVAFALVLVLGSASLAACDRSGSATSGSGSAAVDHARSQVGVRYLYGGSSPGSGFDCSGLTSWAWRQAGKTIPRVSSDQYRASRRISASELRPGDLVFYGYSGSVSHVAMYAGGGKIVHAPNGESHVREDSLSSWWATNRIGYGRV